MSRCKEISLSNINFNSLENILDGFEEIYKFNKKNVDVINSVLPYTNLIPIIINNEHTKYIQYTITSENDRLVLGNSSGFKIFDCDLCVSSSIIKSFKIINETLDLPKTREKNKIINEELIPPYMKWLPNLTPRDPCYNLGKFTISTTNDIYYPRHAIISIDKHVHTYSLYINDDIFNDIFYILSIDENLTGFHNGSFGKNEDHFNINISSGFFPLREIILKKDRFFRDYFFNTKIYMLNEPVQKGIILASNNITNLFKVVNGIYTNLGKTLNDYHLLSSLFTQSINNEKIFFIILFLYSRSCSRSGYDIIPNSGILFVSDIGEIRHKDNPKLYNFFGVFNDTILGLSNNYITTYEKYLSPALFLETPIVLASELIQNENYRNELMRSFSIEIFFNEIVKDKITDILGTEKFYERNSFEIYLKYKILLTILFRGRDNLFFDGLSTKERDIVYLIMRLEIYYLSRLYGFSTEFSILRGNALLDQFQLLSDSKFFIDIVNINKEVGKGVSGQTYETKLDYIGNSMVKFSLDKNTVRIEYLNGLETNKLREIIPNFMYVYGMVSCIDDIHMSSDGSYTLGKKGKICNPLSITNCSTDDNFVGNCRDLCNYLFIEYVFPSITLFDFIDNMDPENVGDIDNFFSIFLQIILALKVSQREIKFVHNDLHLSNILLTNNPNEGKKWEKFQYNVMGKNWGVNIYKYIPIIIDLGYSRTRSTENDVREFYKDDTIYHEELYIFNENTDILTLILDIKISFFMRFHNNNNLDRNDVIEKITKGMYFPETNFIYKFLNTIQFRKDIKSNYKIDGMNMQMIVKDYVPIPGYYGIDDILANIDEWYKTPPNDGYNLVYKWGQNINSGPINKMSKVIGQRKNELKEYMSNPKNIEFDVEGIFSGMEIGSNEEISDLFNNMGITVKL